MAEAIIDGNGSNFYLAINPDGSINTNTNISGTSIDKICTLNTFSGLIIANGSWTGSYCDVLNYSSINILTRPGAVGSLYVDYSDTGVGTLRTNYIYSVSGAGTYTSLSPRLRYFRLRYVNGATDNQFANNVILSEENRGATYLPLISPLSDYYTTLSTKAIIAGKTPAGSYINVDVTSSGNLKVSIEDWNGVVGSIYNFQPTPTLISQNPYTQLVYISSGTSTGITTGSSIGSIIKFIGIGSYVKVLSYTFDNLTGIGSWV